MKKLNKDLLLKIIQEVNNVETWDVKYLMEMNEIIGKEMNKRKDEINKIRTENRNEEKLQIIKEYLLGFSYINDNFKKLVEKNKEQIENIRLDTILKTYKKEFTYDFVKLVLHHRVCFGSGNVIGLIEQLIRSPEINEEIGYYDSSLFYEELLHPEFEEIECHICNKEGKESSCYIQYSSNFSEEKNNWFSEIVLLDPQYVRCMKCFSVHCRTHTH